MNDEGKIKKTWKDCLKKNDLGLRLLLGLIVWLFLTAFFHFREMKVETLEIDTPSEKYVVAQVDFEFPDEDVMFLLRQDAIAPIGKIYKINEEVLRRLQYQFEYLMLHDLTWKKKFPDVSLESMNKISDILFVFLNDARFVDSSTEDHLKKYDFPMENLYVYTKDKTKKIDIPKNFWGDLKNEILEKRNFSKDVVDFVFKFYQKTKITLMEDFQKEKKVKDYVIGMIPVKYSYVSAGSKIIERGEKVTKRHITMLNSMKEAIDKKKIKWSPFLITGNLLIALIFVVLSFLYLKIEQKEILKSLQKLSLLVCIVLLTLAFAKTVEYLLLKNTTKLETYPLIVPFATILFLMLFNSRIALYGASFLSIILAVTLAVDHSRFLILNLISSLVAIISTKSLRRRKDVFEVCGKCLIGAIPIVLAYNFMSIDFGKTAVLWDISICVIFMAIIAILVVGILPVLESLFNVMTDITIMEYMDPNNELLKRLILEMPGTYQHSLVLGNLAEIAAQAIGSNGLVCRVGSLYHDIGKLNNAQFFTENQQSGVNIHQLLTPTESAQVIISHVKDGVMLAKKYRLPQSFIDIIQEHHGTTLAYYFYHKELELHGGDKSKVEEFKFRYPGPKPQSKESAIVMIADGVEALSRSADEFTEETLEKNIDELVKDKADDGQFDECDLTFQELRVVKKTLLQTLISTMHVRIKYPKKEY